MESEEVICVACDRRIADYIQVRGVVSSARVVEHGHADGRPYVMPTVAPRGRGSSRGRGRGAAQGNDEQVKCACGATAKKLRSQKDSSRGREFWCCGKNRSCDFFKWAD
jgi:hypothetical protein